MPKSVKPGLINRAFMVATFALFAPLLVTACGKNRSVTVAPEESSPSPSYTPVEPSSSEAQLNYHQPLFDSIQNSFCQSVGDGDEGELQICCSPSVTEKELYQMSLPEIEACPGGFEKHASSCLLNTKNEGVIDAQLWSCRDQEVSETVAEVLPAVTSDPVANQASAPKLITPDVPNIDDDDEDDDEIKKWWPFNKTKKREDTSIEVLTPRSPVLTSAPLPEKTPISVPVPKVEFPVYFELSAEAELLGLLPQDLYLKLQQEIVGSKQPACNFFLTVALCQAGYCVDDKPHMLAAHFDSYFYRTGWEIVDLATLKQMFREKVRFDSVLQIDPLVKGQPGHVSIPIGLDSHDRVVVAQGNLNKVTNEIKSLSDRHIKNWKKRGFTIFVKRTKDSQKKI